MPYGEKSQAQLDEYVSGCLDWLFTQHQVKMVVVACNTASAATAHLFRDDVPFIDPVTPICRWLAAGQAYQRVGVMATRATVASGRYRKLLSQVQSPVELYQVACGNLATIIEEGRGESAECRTMIGEYLQPLLKVNVEAIILGCTHYPYVMSTIAEQCRPSVDILDPALFMALEAKRVLNDQRLASPQQTGREIATVDYFVTAEPDRFYETSRRMPFQALAMKQPVVVSVESPLAL
jgi:glutamate racemase